jgi:polysaccharide biosynthesis protein PslG
MRSNIVATILARVISVLIASLIGALSCAQASKLVVGISAHFGQGEGDPRTMLPQLTEVGWKTIRDEFYWSHIEDDSGGLVLPVQLRNLLKASQTSGIKLVVVLGYGHPLHTNGDKPITALSRQQFGRYVRFVVEQTRDVAVAYEIWNEWDIGIGGGTAGKPTDYLRLVEHVAPIIRESAVSAIILAGSATPESVDRGYLDELIRGGLLRHVDAISIHPYVWERKSGARPADMIRWVTALSNRTPQARFWITETGWPTHYSKLPLYGRIYSLEQQAQWLCESLRAVRSLPQVSGFFWYTLFDRSARFDPEASFGLIDAEGHQKPAFNSKPCLP